MPPAPKTLATLTAADFRPLLDQALTLELAPGHAVDAVLIAIDERPELRRLGSDRDPFSLILRAPPGSPLVQGTFALSHAALGRLEVFMSPLQPRPDGARYQAVFS
jgi:hypothetical protein